MAAVGKWAEAGGKLVLTAGAGMLNETNQTNVATRALLPALTQKGLYTGTRFSRRNASIYYVKALRAAGESVIKWRSQPND